MKKIVLLSVLVLTLFAACGGVDDRFKDEPEKEALTGVLIEQSVSDTARGSHFLLADDGERVTVRSVSINLSAPEYLNNELELMGVFSADDGVFEVTGVSVLDVLSDLPNEEAQFIEYKNSELGFELKYYDDWTMVGDNDGIFLYSPSTGGPTDYDVVTITQFPFEASSTEPDYYEDTAVILVDYFEQYLSDEAQFSDVDGESLVRQVGPDELDALKLEYSDGVEEYLFYRSGLVYSFNLSASGSAPKAENKKIFNEMLAEFRFIGFEVDTLDGGEDAEANSESEDNASYAAGDVLIPETPDMEFATFESLSFDFSGKYPADWYYAGAGSSEPGVLRHYGFADTPDFEEDILSLDIISGDLPGRPNIDGRDLYEVRSGNTYTIYNKVEGNVYKFSGDLSYQDLLFFMAINISPIDDEL